MTYDDWKTTPPGDDEPDVEACGHRVGTCEGECRMDTDPAPALEEESGMSEQNYEREVIYHAQHDDLIAWVAQLLADTEAAAYERGKAEGAEPWELLAEWESADYRSVTVEHRGVHPPTVVLGWADEGYGGGMSEGSTASEAARALCVKLGLLKGEVK